MTLQTDGRAYGRSAGTYDAALTEVGPGTPMGEYMRRYWHPIGLAADAGATPKPVRILGEDLILFRDQRGRAGLVQPRCTHRGASLLYGKVEEDGIRCAYHAWKFDAEGRCLDMPMSKDAGAGHRERVRQPWYPVQERYGLVFVYMGPAEKQPALPRYGFLEDLREGERVAVDDSSIGTGGPVIADFNWLQNFENTLDPDHLPVLHYSHSGPQFPPRVMKSFAAGSKVSRPQVKTEFRLTPLGVEYVQLAATPGGATVETSVQCVLPNIRLAPGLLVVQGGDRSTVGGREQDIGWIVPIDDTHFRIFVAGRVSENVALLDMKLKFNGRWWSELSPEDHLKFPGDYEIQSSQGAITLHSDEHLVPGDQGVAMLRRRLREQVKAVAAGGDPIGVSFDPNQPPLEFSCLVREVSNAA